MADKSFWKDKKDAKWFANLWYYYKKVFLAGLLVTILLVYGVVSCIRTIDYDLEMYYMGQNHLTSDVFDKTKDCFSKIADDVDGKDGTQVICHDFSAPDDSQASSEIDFAMQSKVQIEIAEGEGYVYIMSEKWLDYCVKCELLEDISEYTGEGKAVYAVEITDNKLMNSLGFDSDEKLFVGIRILNNNRVGKEKYEKKHNNALKVIEYICKENNF